MNRLLPPPAHPVPRVFMLCLAYALLLLWSGGGSPTEALSMLGGLLRFSPDGANALHALLPRAARSFILVLLALIIGLSFALALTLMVSLLGGRGMRIAGWFGRALAGVPPMAWAMGGLILILRGWNLPVETLFPHQTPPELDTWIMRTARTLWAWLAPAVALSLPVFGSAFFSLTHRLSALLESPGRVALKARGLARRWIIDRHFAPLLSVQMARLARPACAALLCFTIPVEEIFGFDGWGRFVAARLLDDVPQPQALATAMWAGAWMIAGLLIIAGWPDRHGLPPSVEEIVDHGQRRSLLSAGLGGVLLAALVFLPAMVPGATIWSQIMASHDLWLHEVPRAAAASLGALLMVILGVPLLLPSLRSRWLADGGIIASWGIAPLFLMVLLWEQVHARSWPAVMVVLAAPGLGALRGFFLDEAQGGVIEASRAVGESTFGLCYRHLLRLARPGLLSWAVRTTGSALILFSVLDFYDSSLQGGTAISWGALMRAHHDDLLDRPALTLGPAVWITLWSLSFRLLSRAFRTETPPNRCTTFAP